MRWEKKPYRKLRRSLTYSDSRLRHRGKHTNTEALRVKTHSSTQQRVSLSQTRQLSPICGRLTQLPYHIEIFLSDNYWRFLLCFHQFCTWCYQAKKFSHSKFNEFGHSEVGKSCEDSRDAHTQPSLSLWSCSSDLNPANSSGLSFPIGYIGSW